MYWDLIAYMLLSHVRVFQVVVHEDHKSLIRCKGDGTRKVVWVSMSFIDPLVV